MNSGIEAPATRCDALAASPYDPARRASGVAYSQLEGIAAAAACKTATIAFPRSSRFYFQLGRALEKLGHREAAVLAYERAEALGHAGGSNNLGELYRDGKWVSKNPIIALAYFAAAADVNYPEAQLNLGLLLPTISPDRASLHKARLLLVAAGKSGLPGITEALRSLSVIKPGQPNPAANEALSNYEAVIFEAEQERLKPKHVQSGGFAQIGWTKSFNQGTTESITSTADGSKFGIYCSSGQMDRSAGVMLEGPRVHSIDERHVVEVLLDNKRFIFDLQGHVSVETTYIGKNQLINFEDALTKAHSREFEVTVPDLNWRREFLTDGARQVLLGDRPQELMADDCTKP